MVSLRGPPIFPDETPWHSYESTLTLDTPTRKVWDMQQERPGIFSSPPAHSPPPGGAERDQLVTSQKLEIERLHAQVVKPGTLGYMQL